MPARKPVQPDASPSFVIVTRIALVICLVLVAARCTMTETIRDSFAPAPGTEPYPLGPGASTSIFFDVLCCLPALLVLLRRLIDKTFALRFSWSQIILVTLLSWMALSLQWASDKFSTLISVSNVIAAFALMWATWQIVHDWLSLRLVTAVAYGLLLVYTAQGLYYKLIDVPDTIQGYQENKAKILKDRGWKADDFNAQQFEKKIMSGEILVFSTSPNSFAAIVVLFLTITIGIIIQRIALRDSPGWPIVITLVIPFALWLLYHTHSKAAVGAPVLAIGLFITVWILRGKLAESSRWLFWMGVAAIAFAFAAVIGHGLFHHSLPTASLNFRWHYWIAAAQIFREHPLLGTGWDNFGLYYLRHRLPMASEEIKDPHNFIVKFFVELGAVGGVLLLAWLLRLWWELTRPITPPAPTPPTRNFKPAAGEWNFGWIAAIIVLAILLNILTSIDFSQGTAFITVELMRRTIWLGAFTVGILIVILKSIERPEFDSRPAPWILYGILIALGVFLINNLIEFCLFDPGTLCLFALLSGAALGVRQPARENLRPTSITAGALAISITALLAFIFLIELPIAFAESDARAGDELLRKGSFEKADESYESASHLVPFNSDYAYRAALALYYHGELSGVNPRLPRPPLDWMPHTEALLDFAAAHNPSDPSIFLSKATLAARQHNPDEMIAGFDKAVQLNPNEVSIRLDYAKGLLDFAKPAQAKSQLEAALYYNNLLDANEPKRLSAEKLRDIQKQIAGLK